jgi:hypothetical protein
MENKPANKVHELGPHSCMSVDQLIDYLDRNRGIFEDVVLVGWDKKDDFTILSNKMDCKTMLWCAEWLKRTALGVANI